MLAGCLAVLSTKKSLKLASVIFVAGLLLTDSVAHATFLIAAVAGPIMLLRYFISPKLRVSPVDLTGQTVIVTGANSGCGKETARLLFAWGATVIIACRDTNKGEEAAREILKRQKAKDKKRNNKLLVEYLDLAHLGTVRAFVQRLELAAHKSGETGGLAVNVLINNAGVRTDSLQITADDIELHYQVALSCTNYTRG